MRKKISVIQVPFGLGAGREGTERGPESMLEAGLYRQLRNLGFAIEHESRVEPPASRSSDAGAAAGGRGSVQHLAAVKAMSRSVADKVSEAVGAQSFPLVLGGDRSVSIGAFAGLTRHYSRLGVVCFDAHAAVNTEETTPLGHVNGMAMSVALGRSAFTLADIPGSGLPISKQNVVLIGLRDLEPNEREWIRSERIAFFSMHEIDRMGIERVVEQALRIAGKGTDGIHVCLDTDVLDPLEAPGVGLQVPGGLSYREAHFALELLAESGRITSMDVTEVNALLDDNRRTARLAVGLITSVLGKRII
ncbi:MAG TPA: arginase [Paenibacillus sp.]|uniref:arginase n=1 Tax=Paenibacillus sp. TaxID=58172 RepID=UPI0028D3DD94|nr:arginase [Paenibacillus sp.]HUC91063.1 arginase [Paenibacillus sp.]